MSEIKTGPAVELAEDKLEFKRRPKTLGAKVIDMFGEKEKRQRAIDLGLSHIVLPPIQRRGVATYRSLNYNRINPSLTKPEVADPKTIVIPGSYKFYDRGEPDPTKRWKIMKNLLVGGELVYDKVTGKQVIEEPIMPVELHNGYLRVSIEQQYRLYVFLELHPFNDSNKFRPNDVRAVFKRTDLETNKSLSYMAAEQDLALDAEMVVMKMNKDELVAYATSMDVPTYSQNKPRAITEVKIDLRSKVRKDPRKFFAMTGNFEAAVRMNILDAIGFSMIEHVPDEMKFIIPYCDDEPVFIHTADEDPTEALVKDMAKPENKDKYHAIVNMLEFWK